MRWILCDRWGSQIKSAIREGTPHESCQSSLVYGAIPIAVGVNLIAVSWLLSCHDVQNVGEPLVRSLHL
jgi:hypothetical protein